MHTQGAFILASFTECQKMRKDSSMIAPLHAALVWLFQCQQKEEWSINHSYYREKKDCIPLIIYIQYFTEIQQFLNWLLAPLDTHCYVFVPVAYRFMVCDISIMRPTVYATIPEMLLTVPVRSVWSCVGWDYMLNLLLCYVQRNKRCKLCQELWPGL